MSRIDVVVPCYRYGPFLRDSVLSVLRQSHSDSRVLIIDDASPDETPEVAARLADEDSRVTVLTHPVNRGHIATYNEGLEWAESDYVLLLSADDLLAPGALRRAATLMDAHPKVVLTYGGCIDVAGDDAPPAIVDDPETDLPWEIVSGVDFIAEVCRITKNIVPTPTAIARTETQKRIGGYRPDLPHIGDAEMWLRFAAHGLVARTKAVQAFKRDHGKNMVISFLTPLLPDYDQRRAMFEIFFNEHGHSLAGRGLSYAQTKRWLAEYAYLESASKLLEGNTLTAHELHRFALQLCPEMRLRPPLGLVMTSFMRTPRKFKKIARGLGMLTERSVGTVGGCGSEALRSFLPRTHATVNRLLKQLLNSSKGAQ